jgi:hypothetical protein
MARLRRPTWRETAVAAAALALLAPGWRADLVRVPHEEALAAAARSRSQLGAVRAGDAPGEEWHVQYLDSWWARMLAELGLRARLPALVPPDFAAHVAAGSARADGYFRADAAVHWPWWRPGGGVDWTGAEPR